MNRSTSPLRYTNEELAELFRSKANPIASPQYYTTEELAELVRGKANAIRTRLCKTGSYHGIKPVKMPSGRLLWPAGEVNTLLNAEG